MKRVMSCGRALVALGIALCSASGLAQTFTTLDYPNGGGTVLSGVDGTNIVGTANSLPGGFLYNGSTFTGIADPLAGSQGTAPLGISGNNVVGCYYDPAGNQHGFIYNLSTSAFTTLDDPSAPRSTSGGIVGTSAIGISGNNIVGLYYGSSDDFHGFMYNLSTSAYTTLDDPYAAQNQLLKGTAAEAISGNYVVGLYYDSADDGHGFLYNISTKQYTTLDDPLAVGYTDTSGIDGNTVVGRYFTTDTASGTHLYLYDIPTATYTTLNNDPAGTIWDTGKISGDTFVGTYTDSNDVSHGFVATVPEPATLTLLGSALLGLGVVYLRRRTAKAILRLLFATALLASAVTAQADVFNMGGTISGGTWTGFASLQFVTVGDPGNLPDPATGNQCTATIIFPV